MERAKALKCLWNVKGVIKNGGDLKSSITQLYEKLAYSTLKVKLDNVSNLTIADLKNKIGENLSDDDLIIFLRGRMEYDNPLVFLNYIVHCVKIIDYHKNRSECTYEYRNRILSCLYSLYCYVREHSNSLNNCTSGFVLNVSSETVDLVINKVMEDLNVCDEMSADELYDFISKCFKDDNPVKSIGTMF